MTTAEKYIDKAKTGSFHVSDRSLADINIKSFACMAADIARREERESLQKYIDMMADTMANVVDYSKRLTSGNVSHLAPAIQGMVQRRLEYLAKYKIIKDNE